MCYCVRRVFNWLFQLLESGDQEWVGELAAGWAPLESGSRWGIRWQRSHYPRALPSMEGESFSGECGSPQRDLNLFQMLNKFRKQKVSKQVDGKVNKEVCKKPRVSPSGPLTSLGKSWFTRAHVGICETREDEQHLHGSSQVSAALPRILSLWSFVCAFGKNQNRHGLLVTDHSISATRAH